MSKKALITGITGQDGSYLAEFLLHKGYEVHGIIRRASTFNTQRVDHIYVDAHIPKAKLFLHHGDISDSEQLANIIDNVSPDEIYHLAAQSHVRISFDMAQYTGNTTGLGTTRILDIIKKTKRRTKFYQASSSEMFGKAAFPQNENTAFCPRSPYAVAKLYAYWMAVNYREGYNMFVSNGILFNHESPRRGETFVTRKIARGAANIVAGREKKLYLGNLKAKRDWGYAPEYVELMWKILQSEKPDDFVIGTGSAHSVEEFAALAFSYAGLDRKKHIEIDERYYRPTEVHDLLADSRKAKEELGWKPKITFEELVKIMVDADMREIGLKPVGEGDRILKEKFPDRWWQRD
ncbi:MAG: GDP-mannose 4,6-dehydratase [Omnitrophica bacterium]|nr:GDP-mannose 4,6-dehydratase [Candidatus Omnitrophota bacterium]